MIFSPNSDAGSVFFGGSGDGHWDFRYNGRSELTGGMRKTGTSLGAGNLMDPGDFDYIYDPIGNRESYRLDGGTATTYTTNNLNQYTATADPTEYFCYDADGNLIADGKPTSDCNTANGAWAYTWDGENRLIRVEPAGTPASGDKKLEFQYDYRSRRVRKTSYTHNGSAWVEDADLLFVYDDWNVVLVLDANDSNAVARKCTWGLDLSGLTGKEGADGIHNAGGIGGLLAIEDTAAGGGSSHSYWFFYDANGNVGQLIKASDRSLAAHYEYDPYGNTITATGPYSAANPWRFSTKWHDTELPGNVLIYYGYRYYNPRLGRWMNRDPIEELGGSNLYSFAENRAISRVDPLGKQASQPAPPPTDICKIIGDKKDCDPTKIPPGPIDVPIKNLTHLGILKNACGQFKITAVKNCKNTLTFTNLALLGDGCADFKKNIGNPCKSAEGLADGKERKAQCLRKTGKKDKDGNDIWEPDPKKMCCNKVSFSGTYATSVNVDLLIPLVCHIKGSITADITVDGTVGQCKDTPKK